MEIRKDIPEEVKNQTVNGKKRVVTRELPEKIKVKVAEKIQLKQKRLKEFVRVSVEVVHAQAKQQELLKTLSSADDSIKEAIQRAFKKLRLGKEKEYEWRFDGRGSFIGVMNPKNIKPNK